MRRETKTATPPRGVFKDPKFVTIYQGVTRYVHPIHGYEWYCARVGGKSESWHDTEIEAVIHFYSSVPDNWSFAK